MDNTNYIKIGSPEFFILKRKVTFLKKMQVPEDSIKEIFSIKYRLPKETLHKLIYSITAEYKKRRYKQYLGQLISIPKWKKDLGKIPDHIIDTDRYSSFRGKSISAMYIDDIKE